MFPCCYRILWHDHDVLNLYKVGFNFKPPAKTNISKTHGLQEQKWSGDYYGSQSRTGATAFTIAACKAQVRESANVDMARTHIRTIDSRYQRYRNAAMIGSQKIRHLPRTGGQHMLSPVTCGREPRQGGDGLFIK